MMKYTVANTRRKSGRAVNSDSIARNPGARARVIDRTCQTIRTVNALSPSTSTTPATQSRSRSSGSQ